MILFYTNNINEKIATLEAEEAIHCAKTLRKKVGDEIHVVDGKGGWHTGNLVGISKKTCTVAIQKTTIAERRADYRLHIAIAPTKNINRLEWFLEKMTEIGIDEITLIVSHHSERRAVRLDRLEKVVIAAMKQSLKPHLPKLNELTKFSDFIQQTHPGRKFIAHCNDGEKAALQKAYTANEDVLILIGPEGDFSMNEVEQSLEQAFEAIHLGKERLRTETAGIVAGHTVSLLNNQPF